VSDPLKVTSPLLVKVGVMLVPAMTVPLVWPETSSVSPANAPPVIDTVALARSRLSGSLTVTVGDNVVGSACSSVHDATVVPSASVGGSLTLVTVSVVVLIGEFVSLPPFRVPLGSCTCHVMLRVGFEPSRSGSRSTRR
jgi:hypothetical protein